MSVHKVGTLAEYESTADLTRNADRLISVAVNDTWADTATARSLALQNLGLMRVSTPDVLAGLERLVRHPHPEIRRQAIWALGEVSRDMTWDKDAKHPIYIDECVATLKNTTRC